jgi:hypothetical protein
MDKEAQREYNRMYYRRRKEEIAKNRKKKYWSDPSYRNQLRADARRRYEEETKDRDPRIGYTIKKVNNRELYTITYAAQVTNRTEDTIRSWEKTGDIPLSTYTDSRGWRLYTAHQINLLATAFQKMDTGEWTREIVRTYLKNKWTKETKI